MSVAKSLSEMYGGVNPADVQRDYAYVLVSGETVEYACKTMRDLFIVTDRRILNVDKQGLTGAKKNFDSIAFSKVGRFSVEFGGKIAGLVTVKIWASGAGDKLEIAFDKTRMGGVSSRCSPARFSEGGLAVSPWWWVR